MATKNSNTRSINIPYLTVVVQSDPDFEREKRRELEYKFSNGRKFYGDPLHRGPYED